MSFHVYILRCADDTFYTGYTDDLTKRVAVHNGELPGATSKYTRSRRPVELVYSEGFKTKSDAMKREAALKRLSRQQKEVLISSAPRGFSSGP